MLIDTPGMRELQLSDHEDGLSALFEDIETLAENCRFSNCQHRTEPNCEIKLALESGALAPERMESYEKLQKEMLFQKRKIDKAFASETRQQWKKTSRIGKERLKAKGKI